jgi:hypothetical protein
MPVRDFPGKINYANKYGHQTGSRVRHFFTAWGMNRWFESPGNTNLLVVEIIPSFLGLYVMYTNVLTREELEEFDMVNREVKAAIEKRRAEQAIKDQELEQKQIDAENKRLAEEASQMKEMLRLADMGKHHETVCKVRKIKD